MNRFSHMWLIVRLACALVVVATGGIALLLITPAAQVPAALGRAAPQAQSSQAPADCAQFATLHIDMQVNPQAERIRQQCGHSPGRPDSGRDDPGRSIAARLAGPLAYGGLDVDLVTGETEPYGQRSTFVWGSGSTVVVGYDDPRFGGGPQSGYSMISYSTDGGATFTRPSTNIFPYTYGDPVVLHRDAGGIWYAAWISYNTAGCGGQGIKTFTSPDGIAWTPGACAHTGTADDHVLGWVDNSPASPFYGRMYLSYNDFDSGAGEGVYEVHSDDGTSWSAPVLVYRIVNQGDPFRRNVQITGDTGSSGSVYLMTMDEGGGGLNPRTNYLYRSTDGGVSWLPAVQAGPTFPAPGRTTSGYAPLMFSVGWWYYGWGQAAALGDTVHYAYGSHGPDGDYGDVYYIRSTDAGATWSTSLKLNTDDTTMSQWGPSLSLSQDGTLFVGWYDLRNNTTGGDCTTTSGPCYERWGRASPDNGVSWQSDQVVSDVMSPLPGGNTSVPGDYNMAYANAGVHYQAWMDSRVPISGTAQADVFVDRIVLAQETPTPMITPTPPPPPPCYISFVDVPPSDPFYPSLMCLACRGIVSGYPDGTFRRFNNITRGQLAKIVSGAAGYIDDVTGRRTYEDVPDTNTFWLWVERVTIHGLMSGYVCGGPYEPCGPAHLPYFRWGNNATRSQAAKILSNALGLNDPPPPDDQRHFEDVPSSNPFYQWVERVALHGIMSGYQCGGPGEPCNPPRELPYFRPYSNVTRYQAVLIVDRAFFPECRAR